jgi:hypothetical protein
MKYFTIIVGCLVLLPMSASAEDVTQLGWQEPAGYETTRECDCPGYLCYSQVPTWENGGAAQDETYDPACPTGLVSECADDFPPLECCPITCVKWWGITFQPPHIPVPPYRIRFYGPGLPPQDPPVCNYVVTPLQNEVAGFPGALSYEYCAELPEPCVMAGGGWISIQALYCRTTTGFGQWFWAMHTAPIQGNEGMFRSVYFGYPNWVPNSLVFGEPYDHDFELYTIYPTATESSSWGTVKQLYR